MTELKMSGELYAKAALPTVAGWATKGSEFDDK
jgi:hypothetical protein